MTNQEQAKAALRNWADMAGITPTAFAEATGYKYQHAWGLLRGSRRVTDHTVGRIFAVYGAAAADPISHALQGEGGSEPAHQQKA
ncbi:MAG: hypothetical protein KF821_09170 [Anaerolineales bacterium]|nr:hypothetical protein [Anaerolineales bacterium]